MARAIHSTNIVRLPTAAARKVQQPTPRRCGIAIASGAATPIGINCRAPGHMKSPAASDQMARVMKVLSVLSAMAPDAA